MLGANDDDSPLGEGGNVKSSKSEQAMAKPRKVNMKIRMTFLLPALAIIMALTIISAITPDVMPPLAVPLVALTATTILVLTERKRRGRKSE